MMLCSVPGCRTLVQTGRCEKHKAKSSKNRSGDPFYGSRAWRQLRQERLRCEPLCRNCDDEGRTRLATVVDHIIPRVKASHLELEFDNTQSLCASCHNSKTARETGLGRR